MIYGFFGWVAQLYISALFLYLSFLGRHVVLLWRFILWIFVVFLGLSSIERFDVKIGGYLVDISIFRLDVTCFGFIFLWRLHKFYFENVVQRDTKGDLPSNIGLYWVPYSQEIFEGVFLVSLELSLHTFGTEGAYNFCTCVHSLDLLFLMLMLSSLCRYLKFLGWWCVVDAAYL